MAEMKFSVVAVTASLKQKSVFIECALDVDEDTVTSSSIILLNKTLNTIEMFDAEVDGHIIQVKMKNDPQPGDSYTILIQGTIESIVGDKLESALMREFKFKSEVTSEIRLLSPSNFEKLNAVKINWEEIGDHLYNNTEWQIAKENAFFNIVYQTVVPGATSFDFANLTPGQYYIRGRAVDGDEYGRWSDVVTFIYEEPPTPPPASTSSPTPSSPPPSSSTSTSTPDPSSASSSTTPAPTNTSSAPANDPTPSQSNDNTPSSLGAGDPLVISPTVDNGDPLIIVETDEISLDESPTNGVTPSEAFAFSFSEDIDISNLDIQVYRSDF